MTSRVLGGGLFCFCFLFCRFERGRTGGPYSFLAAGRRKFLDIQVIIIITIIMITIIIHRSFSWLKELAAA